MSWSHFINWSAKHELNLKISKAHCGWQKYATRQTKKKKNRIRDTIISTQFKIWKRECSPSSITLHNFNLLSISSGSKILFSPLCSKFTETTLIWDANLHLYYIFEVILKFYLLFLIFLFQTISHSNNCFASLWYFKESIIYMPIFWLEKSFIPYIPKSSSRKWKHIIAFISENKIQRLFCGILEINRNFTAIFLHCNVFIFNSKATLGIMRLVRICRRSKMVTILYKPKFFETLNITPISSLAKIFVKTVIHALILYKQKRVLTVFNCRKGKYDTASVIH